MDEAGSKVGPSSPVLLNDCEETISADFTHSSVQNINIHNSLFNGKGLNFMHLNIHYLYPKLDELKHLLEIHSKVDVLGLCETFLNDAFCDSELQLNNYQMFRKDRQTNGGGVIVYVKTNYTCQQRPDLECDTLETIWLEIKPSNQKSILLGYVYRPPSASTIWFDEFEKSLEKAFIENKETILLGDFNINFIKGTSINSTWNNITNSFRLSQLVSKPTRVTSTSETVIDHVYSNEPANITNIQVPCLSLSDHFPVCFNRKSTQHHQNGPLHNTIHYRSYKHFNEQNFLKDLECQPWSVLDIYDDPDDALDYFVNIFTDVMDSHLPQRERRVKYRQQPDWFNTEIADAIKSRDSAKKHKNEDQFKFWRQKVKLLSKRAKKSFYSRSINENKRNPRSLWRNLKELSGKSDQVYQTNYINDDDGNPIEDPLTTAETFNTFFTNIFKTVSNPPNSLNNESRDLINRFVSSKTENQNAFQLPFVAEEFILRQLQLLDESKSTGLDGIGPRILKMSHTIIAKPLTKVLNLSIKSSKFPERFKNAKVTPIHKKGSKSDKNNYRPISILPIISKLLERHVANSVKQFLETNELLYVRQSGFRENHSCETALTAIIDDWLSAINDKLSVGTVFLDLTKAFDLVNHSLLLCKLNLYKFSTSSVQWFSSYLTNRSQKVCVSGHMSEAQTITAGVPQGSILGPLLFILYINDLPLHSKTESFDMFADDTTISCFGKTISEVHNKLQSEISKVGSWCKQNCMIPNAVKTKTMYISPSNSKAVSSHISTNFIQIQDESVSYCDSEKLLGVNVDQNLNWKFQAEQVLKKCNTNLYLLLRIKAFLNLHSRKLFFNAYILPYLDYCCTIWGNCSNELLNIFLKFQKRAARIILDKSFDAPSQELFFELRWMTFADRIDYKKAILVYKSLNNICPAYMCSKFTYSDINQPHSLRSGENKELKVPKPNLEFFRKSLTYSGPVIWNKIPKSVRLADTLQSFKTLYLKWKYSGIGSDK